MSTTTDLPYWQLTSIFPDLSSKAFTAAKKRFIQDLDNLEDYMDEQDIHSQAALSLNKELIERFEHLVSAFNNVYTQQKDLSSYLYGFVSTDAFNDQAQAELSKLRPTLSKLNILNKRFISWLAALDIETLLKKSKLARDNQFLLSKAQVSALHLMGDEAEALTSNLESTGAGAWAKLHTDIISRHTLSLNLPGQQTMKDYNLSELKNLQRDPSPQLRKAAYEAELTLLGHNEITFAAALNSIKGSVNVLMKGRGWDSALDYAIFKSNISKKSLASMHEACKESFVYIRRYLKAKARFLGKDALAWYDILAPVDLGESKRYSWQEAKDFILEHFSSYSAELADFAKRCFDESWIDVPPRKGKTNGAFCMSIPGCEESRIMLNFAGSLDDLFTLAHELGHAYHNHCIYKYERTMLQKTTPMTLAETASIFCETIVVNALLENASAEEKLVILEQDLLGTTQLVLDIYSRFIFEKTVFEKRLEQELSVETLKGIMLDAQASTYGEGLKPGERHPLMWAQKGHYYSAQQHYYNYPYTFGYLFALGLYEEYQRTPEGFHTRYNELLSKTGMADAASLASLFDIDLEDISFWRRSLSISKERVEQFEALVDKFTN